jgi:hypothetical protein
LPERIDGQDVYTLDDLDAFKAARRSRRVTPPPSAAGDPDQMLGVTEFAALLGVPRDTMKRYVEDSIDVWDGGEDGLLPQWDEREPSPRGRGYVYRWRRARAIAFRDQPGRPSSGRPPATTARPQIADLHAVLAEAEPGAEPTARELAAALTQRLGATVTPQSVRRLRRRAREQSDIASDQGQDQ